MSQTYYTLLTTKGAELLANATALGTPLKLTHMAVGDANGSVPQPIASQTQLINEVRRAAINTLFIDKNNPNQIIAEQVIPETEGGWFIHEIGLYDDKGNLIAIGNCPPTYKPQLVEGSGRTQVIRMILIVNSTDAVQLKVDPAVVLATRAYVDDLITTKMTDHEKSTNHPSATTKSKGFVQLSSATDSDSESVAATSKAIKTTFDLANAALKKGEGGFYGTAPLLTEFTNLISHDVLSKTQLFTLGGNYLGTPNNQYPWIGLLTVNTMGDDNGPMLASLRIQDYNNSAYLATAYKDDNVWVLKDDWVEQLSFKHISNYLPIGIPQPWPTTTVPTGWLKCNGSSFNKTLYPKLASAYPSGNLPDLRGEFIRGYDDGRGVDGGRGILSWQGDAIRNIYGTLGTFVTGSTTNSNSSGAFATYVNSLSAYQPGSPGGGSHQRLIFDASTVVPIANENRPRNTAFLYIVKAE